MTQAELQEVFTMADVDVNGLLSREEWRAFRRIFVVDFDKYDEDQDGMLTGVETKGLVLSDHFKGLATVANSKTVFEGFGIHETKE